MTGLLGDTGPVDYDALVVIRDIFLDTEPLVSDSHLDERLDPRPELQITLEAGFNQSTGGRFDIVWTEANCYHFHVLVYPEEATVGTA